MQDFVWNRSNLNPSEPLWKMFGLSFIQIGYETKAVNKIIRYDSKSWHLVKNKQKVICVPFIPCSFVVCISVLKNIISKLFLFTFSVLFFWYSWNLIFQWCALYFWLIHQQNNIDPTAENYYYYCYYWDFVRFSYFVFFCFCFGGDIFYYMVRHSYKLNTKLFLAEFATFSKLKEKLCGVLGKDLNLLIASADWQYPATNKQQLSVC